MSAYQLRTEIHGDLIAQDCQYVAPNIRDEVFRRVLDTADAQIRAKLIEMGWTPPARKGAEG